MIVRSLANVQGELIVASGASVANKWGLTTQVPVRYVFLTTGHSRVLQVGKTTVDWLGKASVEDAVSKLHKLLPEREWRALVSAHRSWPVWMAKAICARSSCTCARSVRLG